MAASPSYSAGSRVSEAGDLPPPPMDLSHHWSLLTKSRTPSAMKGYYKFFQAPGVGNLAGGLPNVRFFPFDTLEAQAAKPERWQPSLGPNEPVNGLAHKLATASLSADPSAASHIAVPKEGIETDPLKKIDLGTALQYGQANGYPPLLSWVRQFTREHLHPNVPYRGGAEVALTVGATDGFSKAVDLLYDTWFAERGDDIRDRPGILCEEFTYMSAVNQATSKGVQAVPVKKDAGGILATGPGSLEDVLSNWDFSTGKRPKALYNVTMGHNPTGYVLSLERRKEVYAVCSRFDVIIVEDDPYWYLQFPSAEIDEAKSRNLSVPEVTKNSLPKSSGFPFLDSLAPSYLNIDVEGRVIRLDTFSKTVAPGCRLGWITAQPDFIERIVRISESGTQQPSGFVQSLIAELVLGQQTEAKAAFSALRTRKEQAEFSGWKMDGWVRWLEGLRGMYERRMNRMCTILDEGSFQIKTGTPVREADADWGVVSKTQILEFDWPRGGMFVWVRVNLEKHPLFEAVGSDGEVMSPVSLTTALMIFLTTKPHLVVGAVGLMFSATDQIRDERGWAYYRLCFAAESEENVDACSQRFVNGVQKFWRIKDVKTLEDLLEPLKGAEFSAQDSSEELGNLGMYLGC